ncbi:hypothetical protein JOF56_010777 [Kibdelosporangium banguiense]|uniref:Uncharacterized protein n=1 Tax=Kibdelosporangium banguiense TaxID=1365924 RepID=A0ABS4U164_9PSEU|nr:hypothetical protein [Kibdelosporangium banguiense]MBP2330392.1 hypothetical protein [Kibdelosporangium banguiense]
MTGPLRPAFHEGQVLAAADLSATVTHARAAAARHSRYLHDWGVAEGLELLTENRTDPVTNARFVEVRVSPGLAIDGNGREVVVPETVVLRESDFEEVNGADPATTSPYPVFLTALDREPGGSAPQLDSCGGNTAKTRVEESYQILFGRLGDELTFADPPPPPVGALPAEPPAPWRVLLGYVQWTSGHFTAVSVTARSVSVRYVGVRADTVAARSGSLTLRTKPAVQDGQPALQLSGGEQPSLIFGLYQGGTVAPLMTMQANGNLNIEGSFSGRISAGSVLVASGTATDGMILPLPAGVTAEQVATGQVVLHTQLTPRVPPITGPKTIQCPVEATVDSSRRVRCLIRLTEPFSERPGVVDFLVLATVTATKGGGRQ